MIIPAFNEERYIGRCLRSLCDQSLDAESFEVIVIDDGSSDHTSIVAREFEPLVHLVSNEANQGLPSSLNQGVRIARSPFIVRVDADDYVNRQFIEILLLFLSENSEFDAVACDYFLVDERERILSRRNCDESPIGCGIMFRRDQLIDLGLYDESFLAHEDQDLRIRFLKKHEIQRIPLPLYRYRRHAENLTNDMSTMGSFQEKLIAKHGELE